MRKIGLIGMGNMGCAIVKGMLASGEISPDNILVSRRNKTALQNLCDELMIQGTTSNVEVAKKSDLIFLCTKPKQLFNVIEEIQSELHNKIIISIAAGIHFAQLAKVVPDSCEILATVPNTPVAIRQGIFAAESTHNLSVDHEKEVLQLLRTCADVYFVPTEELGIFSVLSGCGPGLISVLMEAFADAGVKYGMNRQQAYAVVAQTFAGTALLQKHTGKHPAIMKDEVCSPGGTTIRGVAALEEYGARNALIKSIDAIINPS